jgi:hypothetical protein
MQIDLWRITAVLAGFRGWNRCSLRTPVTEPAIQFFITQADLTLKELSERLRETGRRIKARQCLRQYKHMLLLIVPLQRFEETSFPLRKITRSAALLR